MALPKSKFILLLALTVKHYLYTYIGIYWSIETFVQKSINSSIAESSVAQNPSVNYNAMFLTK